MLFKKCQTFFHQTSMRFHSAMATLETQKYVIAGTVGTENTLLVSGRVVFQYSFKCLKQYSLKYYSILNSVCHLDGKRDKIHQV